MVERTSCDRYIRGAAYVYKCIHIKMLYRHGDDCLSHMGGACRWHNALEHTSLAARQGNFKLILGGRTATEQTDTDA